MLKKIITYYKNLDKITYKIMKNGLKFSFFICIISAFILFTYNLTLISPNLYYIGILLFRLGCILSVEFIV